MEGVGQYECEAVEEKKNVTAVCKTINRARKEKHIQRQTRLSMSTMKRETKKKINLLCQLDAGLSVVYSASGRMLRDTDGLSVHFSRY